LDFSWPRKIVLQFFSGIKNSMRFKKAF